MAVNKKLGGLGKGLDALITTNSRVAELANQETGVIEIDINKIEPNREQPRKYFDEEGLRELADSLLEFGMIQPVIVKSEDGFYSLVAGERRWRAARIAKLNTIPVIIKDYSPIEVLQIALVENIQRKDLNPIEEALCYRRLIDEFFFNQENISQKVGKSRHIISNAISLLQLDARVQNFLVEGRLTSGHGRALLSAKSGTLQFEVAERIIDEDLSVRETERIIKETESKKDEKPEQKEVQKEKVNYVHVERDLKVLFGTQVHIRDGKTKGKIEIEYYSPEELERLIGIFKRVE